MKPIIFTPEEVNSLSPNGKDISEVLQALSLVASGSAPSTETMQKARSTLLANKDLLFDIWRKYKSLEQLFKVFKETMEFALGTFTNEDGEIPLFDRYFKWQSGALTKTVTNMTEFLKLATGYGMTLEEIAPNLKPISVKDAAKALGLSDDNFTQQYGELVEVVQKRNKPTLKGV